MVERLTKEEINRLKFYFLIDSFIVAFMYLGSILGFLAVLKFAFLGFTGKAMIFFILTIITYGFYIAYNGMLDILKNDIKTRTKFGMRV